MDGLSPRTELQSSQISGKGSDQNSSFGPSEAATQNEGVNILPFTHHGYTSSEDWKCLFGLLESKKRMLPVRVRLDFHHSSSLVSLMA